METRQGAIVGIDLGTTYSCIATLDELGNPMVGKNKLGETTTPSVVHFPYGVDPKDSEVGQVAKDSAIVEPDRVIQLFKPLMRRGNEVIATIDGYQITPVEASAHVLRKITSDFVDRYGTPVEGAVITVPAHFGLQEREATVDAGHAAGLEVLGIVQEPVAAAVFYGMCESREDSDVLVYDLGGGTFDVTAVSIRHIDDRNIIDVVCAEGNHELGGRLWDDRVVGYLTDEYMEMRGAGELSAFSWQSLRSAAEDAKKRLSETEVTQVNLMLDRGPARVELTRQIFDELTSDLLSSTMVLTRQALENAKSKGCNVSRILLVGGSTWMPQIERTLKQEFPHLRIDRTDPDEAVASGAAIWAASKMRERWVVSEGGQGGQDDQGGEAEANPLAMLGGIGTLETSSVTSKSYGVKVVLEDGGEQISNLIEKNQPIDPFVGSLSVTKTYYTRQGYPAQINVLFEVFESDVEGEFTPLSEGVLVVEQRFELKEFRLPEHSPIEVTFSLDEQGLLQVHAVEPTSGKDISFERKVAGLTQEQKREIRERVTGLTI